MHEKKNKTEILKDLQNSQTIPEAIVSLFLYGSGDYELAINILKQHYNNPNPEIRNLIIYCLQYIEESYGKLDIEIILDIIANGLQDNDKTVRETAHSIGLSYCNKSIVNKIPDKQVLKNKLLPYAEEDSQLKAELLFDTESAVLCSDYPTSSKEIISYLDDPAKISSAIFASFVYGYGDHETAIEILKRYSDTENLELLRWIIINMSHISSSHGKELDLDIAIPILLRGFRSKNLGLIEASNEAANSIYQDVTTSQQKKLKAIFMPYTKPDTYLLNALSFDPESEDHKLKMSVIEKAKKEKRYCCQGMEEAIKKRYIEYEDMYRGYYTNEKEFIKVKRNFCNNCGAVLGQNDTQNFCCDESKKFSLKEELSNMYAVNLNYCPCCNNPIPKELYSEFCDVLELEYGITCPDTQNYTNLPIEFVTSEWWKKRKL